MNILKKILESTISHLGALIAMATGGAALTAAGAAIVALIVNPVLGLPFFGIIVIGALSFVAYASLLMRMRRRRPVFDAVDADYEYLEREIEIDYKTRTEATYTRRHLIRALKNDVSVLREAYCWTGSDLVSIKVTQGGTLVANTGTRGPFQLFEVHLDQPLKRREMAEVIVIFTLTDREHRAKPFVSAQINDPTSLLRLTAKVYNGGYSSDAVGEETPTPTSRKNVTSTKRRFDKHGRLTWEVKKPRLMHTYELRWKGPEWQ